MGTAAMFAELFAGRTDAWGSIPPACVRSTVDEALWGWHLTDPQGSVGVYPLVPRPMLPVDAAAAVAAAEQASGQKWGDVFARWGCTDLDRGFDTSWPDAVNLRNCLEALGLHPWAERTKSKGWHVWVFAAEWVPAEVMRRALLAAHQIVDVPVVEVNPKQTVLTGQGFGNYVNVPYAASCPDGRRVVAWREPDGTFLTADQFVSAALDCRDTFDGLYAAAKLWVPPKRVEVNVTERYNGSLSALVSRMPGLAYKIFVEGVLEGRDRSRTLTRLAHLLAEAGFTPEETKACIVDADKRFGKYCDRPNADELYNKIVVHAHSKQGQP